MANLVMRSGTGLCRPLLADLPDRPTQLLQPPAMRHQDAASRPAQPPPGAAVTIGGNRTDGSGSAGSSGPAYEAGGGDGGGRAGPGQVQGGSRAGPGRSAASAADRWGAAGLAASGEELLGRVLLPQYLLLALSLLLPPLGGTLAPVLLPRRMRGVHCLSAVWGSCVTCQDSAALPASFSHTYVEECTDQDRSGSWTTSPRLRWAGSRCAQRPQAFLVLVSLRTRLITSSSLCAAMSAEAAHACRARRWPCCSVHPSRFHMHDLSLPLIYVDGLGICYATCSRQGPALQILFACKSYTR